MTRVRVISAISDVETKDINIDHDNFDEASARKILTDNFDLAIDNYYNIHFSGEEKVAMFTAGVREGNIQYINEVPIVDD